MAVSGVYVRTNVHVAARSFTYVANEINRIFLDTIANIGLDVTQYDQPVIDTGLRTWLTLRQIEAAHLEVIDQNGTVQARFDLEISYSPHGQEVYETDLDEVHRMLRGARSYAGCRYRVVVTTTPGAARVRGWSDTTLGSTAHLKERRGGRVINAGRAGATLAAWF